MTARRPPGQVERRAERRVKALELRKAGCSYREIGTALQCSPKTAFFDVRAALRELKKTEEDVGGEVLQLELARLDALWRAGWTRAQKGDPQAIRACLGIAKRRAELLGLDAPDKHEHTGKDGAPLIPLAAIDEILRDATSD